MPSIPRPPPLPKKKKQTQIARTKYMQPSPYQGRRTSAKGTQAQHVTIPQYIAKTGRGRNMPNWQKPGVSITQYFQQFGVIIPGPLIQSLTDPLWKYEMTTITMPPEAIRGVSRHMAANLVHQIRGEPIPAGKSVTITCMRPLSRESGESMKDHLRNLNYQKHVQDASYTINSKIYKGKNCVSPLYVAGYDKGANLFITISGSERSMPQFLLGNYITQQGSNWKIAMALDYTLKTLLYSGFVVQKDIREAANLSPDSNGIRIKLISPYALTPLPAGIHLQIRKELYKGRSLPEVWQESGGYEWHRRLKYHVTDNIAILQQVAVSAMNGANAKANVELRSIVPMMQPTANRLAINPIPVNNISHIMKQVNRPTNPRLLPRNANIKANAIPPNAKEVGRGAYGTVFEVSLSRKETVGFLSKLRHSLTNSLFHRAPRSSDGSVIIKYQRIQGDDANERDENLANMIREAYILNKVYTSTVEKMHGNRKIILKGKDYAPAFFFSGTYGRTHIICMGKVSGKPLYEVMMQYNSIPHHVFTKLEKAVEFLLRVGIVHADLHANNIYVDLSSNRAKVSIIDFGMSVELSPALAKKAVRVLDKTGSIEDAWEQSGLKDVLVAHFAQYDWFHSNLQMLRYAESLVPRNFGGRILRDFRGSSRSTNTYKSAVSR